MFTSRVYAQPPPPEDYYFPEANRRPLKRTRQASVSSQSQTSSDPDSTPDLRCAPPSPTLTSSPSPCPISETNPPTLSPSSSPASSHHDQPSPNIHTPNTPGRFNSDVEPDPVAYASTDLQDGERPSFQLSATGMSDPSTPLQIISVLRRNRIFLNEPEAEETGKSLIRKAKDVLKEKRGSDWDTGKAVEAKEIIRNHCTENETTFMFNLMGAMKGQERLVPRRELTQEEKEQAENWIQRAFAHDHLRMRFDRDFVPGSVPEISSHNNAQWDAILAACPRVKNPKPDVAFSIYKDAFSHQMQDLFTHLGSALNGADAFHVFCVLECKCMNASIQEAENQCLAAGAATVHSRRRYNRHISLKLRPAQNKEGQQSSNDTQQQDSRLQQPLPAQTSPFTFPPQQSAQPPSQSAASRSLVSTEVSPMMNKSTCDKGTPDMESWVFSFAIAADQAKCYVNWCLAFANGVLHWHMHLLEVYSFHKVDDISKMHHDLDNILDWGVGPWKRKVEKQAELKIQSGELLDGAPPPKKRKVNDTRSKNEA